MPDEQEFHEIHDVMDPPAPPLSRHERRQQAREAVRPHRHTGIVICALCGYSLELENEPKPDDCPACGESYDESLWHTQTDPSLQEVCRDRRRSSAIEALGDAAAGIADGVNRFADVFETVFGNIASEIRNLRQSQTRVGR